MLAPWIIGLIAIYAIPMLTSLYYSFTDYNLLTEPKFIGVQNYVRMFFRDGKFWTSISVTLTYVLFLVPLRLAFALSIALLLNNKHRFLAQYRAIYYIPSLIGGSVAVSIIWRQVFGTNGAVMSLLAAVGLHPRYSPIGSPDTALWVLVLLGVWQFGSSMLIFLAALKQIPPALYEASMIDGASALQRFRKITLPMLTPVIFFNLILQIINSFKAFTESFVVTKGGPLDSTLLYVLNLYRRAFTYYEMGYSSAMAWVLVLIIGVFTLIIFKSQSLWVYYETKR